MITLDCFLAGILFKTVDKVFGVEDYKAQSSHFREEERENCWGK